MLKETNLDGVKSVGRMLLMIPMAKKKSRYRQKGFALPEIMYIDTAIDDGIARI